MGHFLCIDAARQRYLEGARNNMRAPVLLTIGDTHKGVYEDACTALRLKFNYFIGAQSRCTRTLLHSARFFLTGNPPQTPIQPPTTTPFASNGNSA
jgi:hypothetical protein